MNRPGMPSRMGVFLVLKNISRKSKAEDAKLREGDRRMRLIEGENFQDICR